MLKLFNQSSRGLPSPALVAALGVLAGGLLSRTASAQDAGAVPNCNSLANHVFVVGSSAVEGAIFPATGVGVAQLLAEDAVSPLVIVYQKPGSCTGVNNIIGNVDLTGTAAYWDAATHTKLTCNAQAGDKAQVAPTDVFPTSCAGVTQAAVDGASLSGNFEPFVQTMVFVVPEVSSQTTISAEAAYLTFGVGDTGGTPWDNYMLHQVRNSGSGTETMIGKSIGVPAGSWWGVNAGSAKAVATAVSGASATDKVIGILSTAESQDPAYHTGGAAMHMLAYQAYGQSCAFYPDSSVSTLDKAMVRDGHYDIWGPLHLLAKVSAGVPTDAAAKKFIDVMTGKTLLAQPTALIDAEIKLFEVPLCAMNVMRTEELGPLSSVQPTCDCYFESKTGGAPASCKTCTVATESTDCTGTGEKCNYGYCQVMP